MMDSKQELSLQLAVTAVGQWRAEEQRAADGIAESRENAVYSLKLAVGAGVSQADLAKACEWSRQRVNQLIGE
jgi:hypothetical protein